MSFDPVVKVAELMRGYPHPWFISGGWATDLSAGRETRVHPAIEIAIFREEHAALRDWLTDWRLVADYGFVKEPWLPGETLTPAARFVTGRRSGGDPSSLLIRIENTGRGLWYSGDNRMVSHPVSSFGRVTPDGIPYVSPAISLLFRARDAGPLDDQDFRIALNVMGGRDRLWLDRALSIQVPDHPWRDALSPPRPAPEPDPSEE